MTEPWTVRGVCFDLWNTLVFTDHSPHPIDAIAAAFGLSRDEAGGRLLEEAIMTRPISGISEALDVLATATSRRIREPWTREKIIRLWGEAANRNRLYVDAIPALRDLGTGRAPLRIGLLSNTQSFDLDILRRSGLELFFDVICLSCHTGLLKPRPDAFLKIARLMKLAPGQVVMVGDRVSQDARGASEAGMRSVLLDRTGSRAGRWPVCIRNLRDLGAMLRRPDGLIGSSC